MNIIHNLSGILIVIIAIIAGTITRFRFDSAKNDNETTAPFKFSDITTQSGIIFQYEDPILDPVLTGRVPLIFYGSGVAVADVNGDGWMDVLFLAAKAGAKNHLYLNQGGKGFKESAEEWGISNTSLDGASVSATFFDYNNDGKPDLFISKLGCSALFKNTGTHFENVTRQSGIGDCRNSIGAIPFDFEGRGLLDLLVIRYWGDHDYFHLKTPYAANDNSFNSLNGGRNTIYKNLGNGRFADNTNEILGDEGKQDTHWHFDAAIADLLNIGQYHLYTANDFGPDTLFKLQNGKLVDESAKLGEPDRRYGMNVSLGDISHDGYPHIFVSNEFSENYVQTTNFLWKFNNTGKAEDESRLRGVSTCGWDWGAIFSDFALEGEEDLYVTNGLLAYSPPPTSVQTPTLHPPNPDYRFATATRMSLPSMFSSDVRNLPKISSVAPTGPANSCFFWNRGGDFTRIPESTKSTNIQPALTPGVTNGRSVAAIDIDNNGTVDLAVTVRYGAPHLFRNDVVPSNNWVGFWLVGTTSNRDAVGSRVKVSQGTRNWYRWATGGRTGMMATSDPRLHFGIPLGGVVDVEIRWPTGTIQIIQDVPVGKYYVVKEGVSFESTRNYAHP